MPARQRGLALVAVLLLLVFVLTIVSGLFYRHQIHIQKMSRTLIGEQAVLLLLGAESWAGRMLVEDARSSTIDHLGETWAQPLPLLPVEGGLISGCLRDLQGHYNLNSLGWYTNKSWQDEIEADARPVPVTTRRTLLRGLLDTLGLDSGDTRVAALVDWVDPDSWLVSPDSAEDNDYLLLDPPYRAANHPLVELSELTLVAGFGSEDVRRLQHYASVLPEDTAINVNTAPKVLLGLLSPAVGDSGARTLANARPFASLDDFYGALVDATALPEQTLRNVLPPELVTVSSDYFALNAVVELAGVRLAYYSVLRREGGSTRVLSRSLQFVPGFEDSDAGVNNGCTSPPASTVSS